MGNEPSKADNASSAADDTAKEKALDKDVEKVKNEKLDKKVKENVFAPVGDLFTKMASGVRHGDVGGQKNFRDDKWEVGTSPTHHNTAADKLF